MDKEAAEQFVKLIYEGLLHREPGTDEFDSWVVAACKQAPQEILRAFVQSREYRSKNAVRPHFPLGHFHSPIVDPRTVESYVAKERQQRFSPETIQGIDLDLRQMQALYSQLLPYIKTTCFPEDKGAASRFYYQNGNFPYGDAIILRAMIHLFRPSKIIEIGSGFTSACMLDSFDDAKISHPELVCIDPNASRLRTLLWPGDSEVVRIIERPVQEVGTELFAELRPGDFLFIDSTHVLKTASDVHYELFSILPNLAPGVFVHFHDVQYPFEYPDIWIFERNYSWNEIYAVRAFLMFNMEFRVKYWNSLMATTNRPMLSDGNPLLVRNSGGSIWIKREPPTCAENDGRG